MGGHHFRTVRVSLRPFGDMLAHSRRVSHLFLLITIYVDGELVITKLILLFFKKATGGKLVGSDVFGAPNTTWA